MKNFSKLIKSIMSLQTLIDFANADNILSTRRNENGISMEEKAGKILAALYIMKNSNDSIEPKIFLSVPNSFEHIMNILKSQKSGVEFKRAIENEVEIILLETGADVTKTEMRRRIEEAFLGESKKERGREIKGVFRKLKEEIIDDEDRALERFRDGSKKIPAEITILSEFINHKLTEHTEEIKRHFEINNKFKDEILDVLVVLKNEIFDNLKDFIREGVLATEEIVRKELVSLVEGDLGLVIFDILEKLIKDLIEKIRPYLHRIEERLKTFAVEEGKEIIKEEAADIIAKVVAPKKTKGKVKTTGDECVIS